MITEPATPDEIRAFILRRDLTPKEIIDGLFGELPVEIVRELLRQAFELYPALRPDDPGGE